MGRLRTNTDAPQLIKQFPNYCDLADFKIPKKEISLEIGFGKGDFLIQQAINNPKNFFLGIEKYSTVVLKALKKIEKHKLTLKNLMFICSDIANIDVKKFENKISMIYLNFSDPWPKKRHAKRRLTSPLFLDLYNKILKDKGIVEFKTDNDNLYLYTLDTLKNRKDIQILYNTANLYNELSNNMNIKNVQTEYEKKFVSIGKNINKIVWRKA